VAGTTPAIQAEQGVVTGPLPLTPIQHWFFEHNLAEPHHWNMAMLLEARQPLDSALLERAVEHLLLHHDALRLRFMCTASGWRQVSAAPDTAVPFSRVDLSALSEGEHAPAIEATAAELQASLNLSEGPLIQVNLLDLGAHKPSRLLIVIHHLAVDSVSWRILLEDVQTAYHQLSRGETIELPPKTTSFKHWAERLTTHVHSGGIEHELDHWLARSRTHVSPLPVDYTGGANTEQSARTVWVSLSAEETRALLREVPEVYHTQINDVLLTALVQAFSRWTGARSLLFNLEGHGREEIFEGVDLSRTVGWFTSIFPVLLSLEEGSHPGNALKSVKEQLRRIPNRGIGYGLLRYLSLDRGISRQLQALPQAQVSFNYLGQFDQMLSPSSLFALAKERSGPYRSARGERIYPLEITGRIMGGQLHVDWSYSENVHRHTTIEALAKSFLEALRALIVHCQSPEAGGYTPSDFPAAGLSQGDLDDLMAELTELEGSNGQE
jgi:non-ribosomal peptide synthase protein (TIGR01720 family)